ncbi:hypothetical protein ACMHYB_49060 [Sorangium sp. So ce1128]
MEPAAGRRLQGLNVNLVWFDGSAVKRSRNIGVARYNAAAVPLCQHNRREDQHEEQRDPGEK